MLPVRSISAFPLQAHSKLWVSVHKTDGLLKTLLKGFYNLCIPSLALLVTAVFNVVAFILEGLYNGVIWCLLTVRQNVRKYSLLLGACPKTFQKIPREIKRPVWQNLFFPSGIVCSKNFPFTCQRKAASPLSLPAPQIATSWPPKNKQHANSLFLDFMQEKTTIPETNLSFWALLQMAGNEKGAHYWDTNACTLIPFLFPTRNLSTLNPNAPVLTAEAAWELQNEASTHNIRSKYVGALLMCLQFWGISFNRQTNNFEITEDFEIRIQNIKKDKNRELLFQQVITSLVECGFAPAAVQLAFFLEEHHLDYNISLDMHTLFERLLELERAIMTGDPGGTIPKPPLAKLYWSMYIKGLPSEQKDLSKGCLAPLQRPLNWLCSHLSFKTPSPFEENETPASSSGKKKDLSEHRSAPWIPLYLLWFPGNKPLQYTENQWQWIPKPLTPQKQQEETESGQQEQTDLKDNLRPQLNLFAPPFFCSLAEEQEMKSKDLGKQRIPFLCFGDNNNADTTTPRRSHEPFAEDMNNPAASSVLHKMSFSQKVDSKNLPFTFRRADKPLLNDKVTRLEEWLPLNSAGTNDFGERFFAGEVTIPASDTDFWTLIRQGGTAVGFRHLELSHDVVQTAIPTQAPSRVKPLAPTLSKELVYRIQTDPATASKYLLSVFTYLRFWGLELDAQGEICKSSDFLERAENVRTHQHNHLRIARMGKSLAECGFISLAIKILTFFKINHKDFGLNNRHNPESPSSFVLSPLAYIAQQARLLPQQTTGWNASPQLQSLLTERGCYLDDFAPSNSGSKNFDIPPQWVSLDIHHDPVFQGENCLLKWDVTTNRWDMPHLLAPPFFCTREEQEQFESAEWHKKV